MEIRPPTFVIIPPIPDVSFPTPEIIFPPIKSAGATAATIAAILTIIGYAINDTVVVFDRIREYLGLYPKRTLRENVNNAINSTLSRTINTSGTTLVTLLAIFFFGGETIRGFIFALIIGVVVGTIATIFIATPIAYDLMTKHDKKLNA